MAIIECPECGGTEVMEMTEADSEGKCEYHCDKCGKYFVAEDRPENYSA